MSVVYQGLRREGESDQLLQHLHRRLPLLVFRFPVLRFLRTPPVPVLSCNGSGQGVVVTPPLSDGVTRSFKWVDPDPT